MRGVGRARAERALRRRVLHHRARVLWCTHARVRTVSACINTLADLRVGNVVVAARQAVGLAARAHNLRAISVIGRWQSSTRVHQCPPSTATPAAGSRRRSPGRTSRSTSSSAAPKSRGSPQCRPRSIGRSSLRRPRTPCAIDVLQSVSSGEHTRAHETDQPRDRTHKHAQLTSSCRTRSGRAHAESSGTWATARASQTSPEWRDSPASRRF
jgi:hypothetical protein